jgi:hypothetical protein
MANGGPTDELLHRLLAAVATEATGDRIDRLINDARAEAEAEVKALLKASYKASLLRAAAQSLENHRDAAAAIQTPDRWDEADLPGKHSASHPPNDPRAADVVAHEDGEDAPEASGTAGCYVYAITPLAAHEWIDRERGVDPRCRLEVVAHEDVQAIVSAVSLEEFSPAALGERVGDPAWVEEKVRAHDHVIRRAMGAADTVIPCRFCTVVRSVADVRRLLVERHDDVGATLADLRGKQEWGVKVYVNLAELSHQHDAATDDDDAGAAPGTDYLRRRQRATTTRDDAERRAAAYADECHVALAAAATDAVRMARRPRTGGKGGSGTGVDPVLNGAYLVAERDVSRFHETLNALAERFRPLGVTFEMTGPWPPYNFVRLDLSLQAAA